MAKQPTKPAPKRKARNHRPSEKETTDKQFFSRLLHRAYLRDGGITHTGEALALALLLHAKGKGRTKSELEEISRIMKDPNLEEK